MDTRVGATANAFVLLKFSIKELLQLQQSVPTNKLLFRVNLCDLTQLRKGPPDLFCQNKKQRSLRNAAFILDTRVGATANAFVLLKFSIKELGQLQQSVPTNKLLFRVNLYDLTQLRKGPPDLFCQNKKQRFLRNAAFILDTRVGATANAFVLLKFSIKELLQLQQHMLRLRQP